MTTWLTATQANRPLQVFTPLGQDVLLPTGFHGSEGLSQPFRFELDLVAEHLRKGPRPQPRPIDFQQLLGQDLAVQLLLSNGELRYFHGVCHRIRELGMDEEFTQYQVELVSRFQLLAHRVRSRIFQPPDSSVPAILKQVFAGIDVELRLQGQFRPRKTYVQYQESDFAFASRLMEEEGIYYYFKFAKDRHTLVLANTPFAQPTLPGETTLVYNAAAEVETEPRIQEWIKTQEFRSGRYSLSDYSFERPTARLQGSQPILHEVHAGQRVHHLNGINTDLDIHEYPGGYARGIDGVTKGGGDNARDLSRLDDEAERIAKVRMEEETAAALAIEGTGTYGQMLAGHRFHLQGHVHADGDYVLTRVEHFGKQAPFRSGGEKSFEYRNRFTCIPAELPYRPARTTPRPRIAGTQTAFVTGLPGDEITTDKYGRVKVRLWDADRHTDNSTSCWVRVSTPSAGRGWGYYGVPRVGQEVVVAFEDGDPDRPLIVGSVYNYDNMPPYSLPKERTRTGIRTRSVPQGDPSKDNEIRFEDRRGAEQIYIHAGKDFSRLVENDDEVKVQHNQAIEVGKDRTQVIKEGNETVAVKKGNRSVAIDLGNDELRIQHGNQTTKIDLGKSETEALQAIEFRVGQNLIRIDQKGVTVQGLNVRVEGAVQTEVKGLATKISGDATLQMKGTLTTIN